MGGVRVRRSANSRGARRPGPAARAAPLFLEEREMGSRHDAANRGAARFLGVERVSHSWRSLARAALLGRLTPVVAALAAGRGGRACPGDAACREPLSRRAG